MPTLLRAKDKKKPKALKPKTFSSYTYIDDPLDPEGFLEVLCSIEVQALEDNDKDTILLTIVYLGTCLDVYLTKEETREFASHLLSLTN